jgi:hypothetical protein
MDQHVRSEVTGGLRRRGVDVLTAFEDGTSDWDDERLLERATGLGRLLFTQDQDFLAIAHAWLGTGRDFAGLAYAHQRGITIGQAVGDLELIAVAHDPEEMRNRVLYLPFP